MSLWEYASYRRSSFPFSDTGYETKHFDESEIRAKRPDTFLLVCPYCDVTLSEVRSDVPKDWKAYSALRISMCPCCGWHSATQIYEGARAGSELDYRLHAATASLKEFTLTDLQTLQGRCTKCAPTFG